MRAAAPKRAAVAASTGARACDSCWMPPWKRFTTSGHGERPNTSLHGLSASGSAAPAMAANTDSRFPAGVIAVIAAIAASPVSPSGTATLRK